MSQRPTNLQTPSRYGRRQTLGPVPNSSSKPRSTTTTSSTSSSNGRRQSLAAPLLPPDSTAKPARSRMPRKSMIPRVGRENALPPMAGGGGGAAAAPPSPGGRSIASQQPSQRRQSISSTATGRSRGGTIGGGRQSLVPPAHSSIRDPRNLQDRAFQQDGVRKIIHYLQRHGYDHPLTKKTFEGSPSSKDFHRMITFLLRRVDPTFRNDNNSNGSFRVEDEIVLYFKALGYPITMSKTSIASAGSSHSWPTLLGAMAWLVDHLNLVEEYAPDMQLSFEEQMQQPSNFESLEELQLQSDEAFYAYLPVAYKAFMEGEMDHLEHYKAALAAHFERDDAILEQEIHRVQALNTTIEERTAALLAESEALPALQKKRNDFFNDLEQFRDLANKMDTHTGTLQAKLDHRMKELEETNAKLERMETHIHDLKKTIATQPMSIEDLNKLEAEHKGIQEAADRTNNILKQRKEALRVVEVEMAQCLTELDLAVADYNSKLSELSVALGSSEWSKYKAQIDKDQLDHDNGEDQMVILGVDLHGMVKPNAERKAQELQDNLRTQQQEYQNALDETYALSQAIDEVEAKIRILREKADKMSITLNQEKEAHQQTQGVRQRQVDTLEQKVAALRDPIALEEQLAAYRQQCAALEGQLERAKHDHVTHVQHAQQQIHQALCLMEEHKAFVAAKLQELEDYWKVKTQDLQPLQAPHHWGKVVE